MFVIGEGKGIMTKKKRQRNDEATLDSDMSSPSPKGIDKTPNNNSDNMNSNTNFTPPNNDDPSTWSKSKRKRMRQKRNKAAKKLLLASSGDNTSSGSGGGKQDNVNGSSSNVINSPSKQTASAMQKMNMNSPNNSIKSNSTAHSNGSNDDCSSKKRHKKNPDIDKSQSKKSADKSIDISDRTVVSNEDSRSPNRKEKQKNDTEGSPISKTHIDGEDTPTKKKRKKKKKKKSPVKEGTSSTTTSDTKNDTTSSNSKPNSNNKQTTNNNKKANTNNNTATQKPASPKLKISLPKQSQMSTLQKSFLERLTSSRFRELNEELYTHSSQHSFDYFTANPELFDQYHVGFRKQVEDWPVNPVDVIYKKIVSSWRKDRVDKKSDDSQEEEQQTVVADFGCGDAKLGERLLSLVIGKDGQSLTPSVSSKKKNKKQNQQQQSSICPFKVHSFDLVSGGNKLVTPADMANLPLQKECIDVGVYSLALMGTNVADFVREAWRVLKFNGVLRVAEVRSRFETAAAEDNDTNKHGGGKRGKLNNGKKSIPKKKNSKPTHSSSGDDNEYNTPQPIMLLDEFLALMERCGFECTNMDRSNKMFLFMDFVKVDGSKGLSEKERFTAKPCIYKRR